MPVEKRFKAEAFSPSDRFQCGAASRSILGFRVHQRGTEISERVPQDHASFDFGRAFDYLRAGTRFFRAHAGSRQCRIC